MQKAWYDQFKRTPKSQRTSRDGTVFDSKAEMLRWETLLLWQVAGHIRNLRRQIKFDLVLPDGTPIKTPKGRTAQYTADFVYEKNPFDLRPGGINYLPAEWTEVIEDVKGYRGRVEDLRISVFEAIYKKKVTIVKG